MQTATGTEFRPFHETIVEDIRYATNEELAFIAKQLKRSVIPANHDEIISAWNHRRKWMCWADEDDLGVRASLLQQKKAAEMKAMPKEKPADVGVVDLHELQEAMETFLSTSHRHNMAGRNVVSWHICANLRVQLEKLHQLISQVLGK